MRGTRGKSGVYRLSRVAGATALAIAAGGAVGLAERASAPPTDSPRPPLVAQYCLGCHNDTTKSGGVSLAHLDPLHPQLDAPLAEKVIHKLRAGMMPPAGVKRPDPALAKAFVASLE